MDYGAIVSRGWQITWNNKFLWVLGFLAALGSAGGGGNGGNTITRSFESGELTPEQLASIGAFAIGLACFALILGLALWLLGLVSSGGLIGAVNRIDGGEKVTLGEAFGMGTRKLGSLVGMSLLLWLPVILLVVIIVGLAVGLLVTTVGGAVAASELGELASPEGGILAALGIFGICLALLACFIVPLAIVLNFIYPFAFRGIMLQDLGAVDSIRHGWQVLRQNFVEILLLGIIFAAIGLVIALVLIAPISLALAVPLIAIVGQGGSPGVAEIALLIAVGLCIAVFAALVNSVVTAWRSATFTLAYQEFTGMTGKALEAETAV